MAEQAEPGATGAPDPPAGADPGAIQPKVSPWLRLYSIGLSIFLATLGTVAVFALFLHGDFLDAGIDSVAADLRPRPALQAFLACTPLIAAILLGFGASAKRRRRKEAEALAEMRKAAGLD